MEGHCHSYTAHRIDNGGDEAEPEEQLRPEDGDTEIYNEFDGVRPHLVEDHKGENSCHTPKE